jgi:hypothetical protein
MKKFLMHFSFVVLVVIAIVAQGCLEDKAYTDIINSENDRPVVSFFGEDVGFNPVAIPVSPMETITLKVTGARVKNDLFVNVGVSAIALQNFNQQVIADAVQAGDTLDNGTPDFTVIDLFELLPDSVYDFPAPDVFIKAGTRDGEFLVNVNTAKISLDYNYLLPLELQSGQGSEGVQVAQNLRNALLYIQPKNKYDGEYTIKIGQTGWLPFGIYDGPPIEYPSTLSLVTSGPNSVSIINNNFDSDLLPGFSTDGTTVSATQFGAASPVFTFNAEGKLTSIANPLIDSRNRQFVVNPAALPTENQFDLATKAFNLNFLFKQSGRPDETVKILGTYKGSR